VVEACLTRIHGPNPGIDIDAWMRCFQLNRAQAELITNLVPERQFLIQGSGIVNLTVDPRSHQLYSTSMETTK
jgi:hypothetical protein